MSELIELHNVARLLEETDRSFVGPDVVTEAVPGMPKSIFKFKLGSVCEVFGYQIAGAIGVRIPQMQGVWAQEAIQSRTEYVAPGRIGILVKYHEDWRRVGRKHAVEIVSSASIACPGSLCV